MAPVMHGFTSTTRRKDKGGTHMRRHRLSTRGGLWAVGLVVASAAQGGTITFSTDSVTELRGTFSFSGTLDLLNGVSPSEFVLGPSFCSSLQGSRRYDAFETT